jgi:hypothetical protein
MQVLGFGHDVPVLNFETDLLTPDQAAALLHCKPSTLARWRRDGDGPKTVKIGKTKIAYLRHHLSEFILRKVG